MAKMTQKTLTQLIKEGPTKEGWGGVVGSSGTVHQRTK